MSLLFPFSSLSFFVAPVIVIVAVVEDVVVEFNDKVLDFFELVEEQLLLLGDK